MIGMFLSGRFVSVIGFFLSLNWVPSLTLFAGEWPIGY